MPSNKQNKIKNLSIKSAKIKKNSVVILRSDFNVSVVSNKIVDTFRIDQSLPTINYLVNKGAKILILAHMGNDGKQSLKPVFNYLNKVLPKNSIAFCGDFDFDVLANKIVQQKSGSIILLENIRKLPGEKDNDKKAGEVLAKNFASLADFYINDAFSVSHRDHMSITSLPKYLPSYTGFLFENEVLNLSKALVPKHPMLFLLGGFKFETKLPVLKKFSRIADKYFVGGALANNYILADGYNVGKSLIDKDFKITNRMLNDKNLIPIVDVIIERNKKQQVCSLDEVSKNDIIADIGPATVELLKVYIIEAKTILWNGPMGLYERGYTQSTIDILSLLAKQVKNKKSTVIIGGGDTALLVHKMKMQNSFTFVSTAGGAALDFLAHGTTLGLEAILKSGK